MEEQAYPVRIKSSGLKMFVVPEKDRPKEFENYLDICQNHCHLKRILET